MRVELSGALLRFFFSTTISSAAVETMAASSAPMNLEKITERVSGIRHLRLPRGAVESSLTLLEGAGLAQKEGEGYRLTHLGEELSQRLAELRELPGG